MTLPKIDEWIKEVEERPGSAQIILKLIAGRLRDLTTRNEELLKENMALQDGSRVEEYKRQIGHLEFQLDMIKRRFGMSPEELETLSAEPLQTPASLLLYNSHGRILRLEPSAESGRIGRLAGEISAGGDAPRLLALSASEEILLLFSSGRVSTCAVESLPLANMGIEWTWEEGALPNEPHAGERLTCLMPLSLLPLTDYFLQASRRGCLKKTMTSIAENVFTNHFLGKGAVQKTDQPFELLLCRQGNAFAMVSHEGRLLGLNVDDLSYAVEERFKLDGTDHVVGGFVYEPDDLLLCLTQTGKVISKGAASLEPMKASIGRGQGLIPSERLAQGIRFIGAAPVRTGERAALLDEGGLLTLYSLADLAAAGSVQTETQLVAFTVLPALPEKKKPA